MYVNTKKMAVSGLLMALAVVFIVLSGILDFNTLFFLAAAAFFVGIIIREFGLRYGAAYFIGCLVLGILLAPQKLYCITYAMMGIYVLGIEFLWHYLGKHPQWEKRKRIFQIGKFVIINVMYLPVLFFFPKLLFAGEIPDTMLFVLIVAGQIALFIYDKAYEYFLIRMWGQVRVKIFGK